MSRLSEEQFKSGKCFAGAGSVQDGACLPQNKFASGQFGFAEISPAVDSRFSPSIIVSALVCSFKKYFLCQ